MKNKYLEKREDEFLITAESHGKGKYVRRHASPGEYSFYAVVVKMGHAGQGYSLFKLLTFKASDAMDLFTRVYNQSRVKRNVPNFILSYQKISKLESKLIRYLNNADNYLNTANWGAEHQVIKRERVASEDLIKVQLPQINKSYKRHDHKEYEHHFSVIDDYRASDVLQRAYGPRLQSVGDEKNPRLLVKYADCRLDEKMLYEYLKVATVSLIRRNDVPEKLKYMVLTKYYQLLPKYKSHVLNDSRPLKVFVEKVMPKEKRDFVKVDFGADIGEDGQFYQRQAKRIINKMQYALCYYNAGCKKISMLIPDEDESLFMKRVDEVEIKAKVERKLEIWNYKYNEEFLQKVASEICNVLQGGEINRSDDGIFNGIIQNIVQNYGDFEFNGSKTKIKLCDWVFDYEGDFISESFYRQKKKPDELSEADLIDFNKRRNKQILEKFNRVKDTYSDEDE